MVTNSSSESKAAGGKILGRPSSGELARLDSKCRLTRTKMVRRLDTLEWPRGGLGHGSARRRAPASSGACGNGVAERRRRPRARGEVRGGLAASAWRERRGRGGLEDPQRRRGGAGSLPGCHRAARGRRQTGGGLGRAGGSGGLQLGQNGQGFSFLFVLFLFFCFIFLPRFKIARHF